MMAFLIAKGFFFLNGLASGCYSSWCCYPLGEFLLTYACNIFSWTAAENASLFYC
jgi:hypothetical protein